MPVNIIAQLIAIFILLLLISEHGSLMSVILLIGYPLITTYVYPDEATNSQNLIAYLFCYSWLTFSDRHLDVIPGYYVLKVILMSLLFLEPWRLVERNQPVQIVEEATTKLSTVSCVMSSSAQDLARRSAIFFLPGLDAILMEKVIAKMDTGSYFRLQQTCHGMYNFIRRCQNISIYLEGQLHPDWNDSPWMYRSGENGNGEEWSIDDIDLLYGVRVGELNLWPEIRNYDKLLSLKSMKISCKRLSIWEATFDQVQQLLTFLDPEEIKLESYVPPVHDAVPHSVDTSNNYMALLQARNLKEVRLSMNHRNLVIVAPLLMAQFSRLFLDVVNWDDAGLMGLTRVIKVVLKILQFGVFPQLRQFRLEIWCDGPMPELPVFEEAFRDLPLENATYDLVPDIVMHPGLERYGIVPHYTRKYKALMRLPPGNIEEFYRVELTELPPVRPSETNGYIAATVIFPRNN